MNKSNCCNASLIENTDICSDCGEHCDPVHEAYSVFQKLIKNVPKAKLPKDEDDPDFDMIQSRRFRD